VLPDSACLLTPVIVLIHLGQIYCEYSKAIDNDWTLDKRLIAITSIDVKQDHAWSLGLLPCLCSEAAVVGMQVLNFERDVTDISSRDVIEMMMITQYFDMLKDIGVSKGSSTVFMPHSPATVADVAGQIRSGFMQAQAGSAGINQPSGHPVQHPMNVGMQR